VTEVEGLVERVVRQETGARFGLEAIIWGTGDRPVDFARHANRVFARTTDEKEGK